MKTTLEFSRSIECPKCGLKADESEVEVMNIESNILGQATVTFECPRCGNVVKSLRHG